MQGKIEENFLAVYIYIYIMISASEARLKEHFGLLLIRKFTILDSNIGALKNDNRANPLT